MERGRGGKRRAGRNSEMRRKEKQWRGHGESG